MHYDYSTNATKSFFKKHPMHASVNKLMPLLGLLLLTHAATVIANNEANVYVDSVNDWGAWELNLEPAAGVSTPSPTRALTSRAANIQFRANDNSAFAPQSRSRFSITQPSPVPGAFPNPTAGPATGPLPTGGPGDRF